MTYEEVLEMLKEKEANQENKVTIRRHHRDTEHELQCACVKWFRLSYPSLVLFAIPNGGLRSKAAAAKLKEEGTVAGVADLFLMVPNKIHHGLFIEMKTEERHSRQHGAQKHFEAEAKMRGYKYSICRTFDQFRDLINDYLQS